MAPWAYCLFDESSTVIVSPSMMPMNSPSIVPVLTPCAASRGTPRKRVLTRHHVDRIRATCCTQRKPGVQAGQTVGRLARLQGGRTAV